MFEASKERKVVFCSKIIQFKRNVKKWSCHKEWPRRHWLISVNLNVLVWKEGGGSVGGGMAVYKINEKGVLVVCFEISRSYYSIIKSLNSKTRSNLGSSKKHLLQAQNLAHDFIEPKVGNLTEIHTMELGNPGTPFYSKSSCFGALDHIVFDFIEHKPTTLYIGSRFYRSHLGTHYKMEAHEFPMESAGEL